MVNRQNEGCVVDFEEHSKRLSKKERLGHRSLSK
jgi:hypothetical protein